MTDSEAFFKGAHAHCTNHRAEIEASAVCGCFYCLGNYPPSEIEDWVEDVSGTAICPRCGIDSVIGNASGLPVTDGAFLVSMHSYWFSRTVSFRNAKRKIWMAQASQFLGRLVPNLFKKTSNALD